MIRKKYLKVNCICNALYKFAVSDQIAWRPEMISAELSGETGV